ncbi:DoxX family protein [Winogradskyella maritima]|uniref:DoxX family membrane protein n=1 Tax=Winogradskyella maritima TaxID=1517766 RepID=A0ABV8ACF4_9FLAO|nr:DoxX family protein [Winogradskyella maritima]
MKTKTIFLILRIAIAVILIQTLRFKFTAHPDSVYIFETVGLEPYGRLGIGVLELIAGILLLIPRTIWMGALLATGLMAGAIFMHLTQLGIDVKGDGGVLFYTAVATFLLSLATFIYYRKESPFFS